MEKFFNLEPHYMICAVKKAGIIFPISKADCLELAGDIQVKVDFNRFVSLRSILERMLPEYYENAASFYGAYMSAQTKELKKLFNY